MVTVASDVSRDAIVIVPGIMGSELVDRVSGRVLWGLSDPRWYVSAWTSGQDLRALKVTEAERSGKTRLQATRLLRSPAFAPLLRGIEPYRDLVRAAHKVAAHPAAVLEFPYDWRLSVAVTAKTFAEAASAHLDRWRHHPEGRRDARLVIIAHSMGGLVAKYSSAMLGGAERIRAVVTLGTPFYGAVKAVRMLATGSAGLPLPHRRLRNLARTLPSIYDLLPSYRCVDEGSSARRLTVSDIVGLGADVDLADTAALLQVEPSALTSRLYPVVGVGQPTMQSIKLRDGCAEVCYYTCEEAGSEGIKRVDRRGDSTVYRDAALPSGASMSFLPQSHGMLARSHEAMAHVRAVITDRPLGPPLSIDGEESVVGLDLPDVVAAGTSFSVKVSNADPTAVSLRVRDGVGQEIQYVRKLTVLEGAITARLTLSQPGIFRVEAEHGSYSPVSQLLLVTPDAESSGDAADV